MRILSITAGAAGMYCGSCFRDNSLARELIARKHDVTLLPLYTPTRTDEPNVSHPRVLFGGISVYLQQHSSLFRKTPRFVDRLWDSPAVIQKLAGRAVSNDARMLGDLTISMLEGDRGVLRKEFEKLLEWIREEPLPDVINLPNSLLSGLAAPLGDALGRPICCTLQGEELFLDSLEPSHRDRAIALIRRHVARVDGFIAVSDYCARFMGRLLEIPPPKMHVVPLGISMEGYERREADPPDAGGNPPEFRVGYFARIAPEKGLHVLADAYVRLRRRMGNRPARLEIAGYLGAAHTKYFDGVRQMLDREGLASEVAYRGELDRAGKLSFLKNLSVLSVPATYDEPKGLFLLEAMASGVPVVQPRRGGFTEIVEKTGGGLLVEPEGAQRVADGLYTLWSDRELARRLSARAYDGVRAHYTVQESAGRLLAVYEALVRSATPSKIPVA